MSIEVRPVGVTCNLRCTYCYEQSMRDVQPVHKYNREAVLAQIDKSTGQWSLFGGEALLLPLHHLEELLDIGYKKFGSTGVQTNATLITERHVDLFEKYNTHVGISMDGPGELNDSRWAGTLEATRKATAKSERAIDLLLERAKKVNNKHMVPSLIITLHAGNAAKDKLPRLKQWLIDLDEKGMLNFNFHTMEMDYQANEWYLPHEELMDALLQLWDLSSKFKNAKVVNFRAIIELLRAKDENVMCTWHSCDPWNTSAVQGLEGDGSPSHCSRTNKDGIDWLPAEGAGRHAKWEIGTFEGQRHHERQLSLYVTPQEEGGCKDCRFWMMCKGQCPGEGDASQENGVGDWRLRSSYCQTWMGLFTEGERRLKLLGETPMSLHPQRKEIEAIMYRAWTQGRACEMSTAIKIFNGQLREQDIDQYGFGHGDHYDGSHLVPASTGSRPHGDEHRDHTDAMHSDNESHQDFGSGIIPHGDEHGDHTDAVILNIPHGDHVDDALLKMEN